MTRKPLSAMVFKGTSGAFVAMCLDLDITAQSGTPEGAIAALEDTYRTHVRIAERRGERPFQQATPSPSEYWSRYERAAGSFDSPTFGKVRLANE